MLVDFGAVSILNYQTFTTAIFQEYEMAFNNNTAALLSGVLMVICIFVVMGEIRFRGTQTLYQSGKGVIRPYPLKPLSRKTNFSRKLFHDHFCAQYWCADYYADLLANRGKFH